MPGKINYTEIEKAQLVKWLEEAHSKLDRKNHQLKATRQKLHAVRNKLDKLKSTVAYQRSRIIELTPARLAEIAEAGRK